MPINQVTQFLDEHKIRYVTITHSPAYTAQEIAAHSLLPGDELAKTVIVKLDDVPVMAVVPASCRIDLDKLRWAAGADRAELAVEAEFVAMFPDCRTGAMPPFGNLYGLPVWVDERLTRNRYIDFNACSHTELMRMRVTDYLRLVRPTEAAFSEPE
ncbi:MAG TPA: YbaK/EbsC family protein [Firmicutes bacterium]|nr:YbaK/EbsC family protein [Bacillota bacterium]